MSAKLYKWLVDPSRDVLVGLNSDSTQYEISWSTSHGPIKVYADTLDAAIKKAYEIDQNPNPEARRRLAHLPTTNRANSVWSTGNRNGRWGWYGFINVGCQLDAEQIDFEVPKLPKGWSYDEFGSNIRRGRYNKRVAYLEQCGRNQWRFRFEVFADSKEIWNDKSDPVFAAMMKPIVEVERAHFVIE